MSSSTVGEPAALSAQQRDAWRARRLAPREEVAADVWALAMPMVGGGMPYTLCYALLDPHGGVHLIDPGWDGEDSMRVLAAELAGLDRTLRDVRTVIGTHFHPDHVGLVPRLRAETGATIILSAAERDVLAQEAQAGAAARAAYRRRLVQWGVPAERHAELEEYYRLPFGLDGLEPDRAVQDGEVIDLPGHRLEAIITPGHTSGHLCLRDASRGVLYAGDHVLPRIAPGIGLGALAESDPLGEYLDALERVGQWDELQVLPGHEYRFRGLAQRTRALAAHQLRRTREVAILEHELGDVPVWEYAARMTWAGGWADIKGFFLDSALRQTAMHRAFLRSDQWVQRQRMEAI